MCWEKPGNSISEGVFFPLFPNLSRLKLILVKVVCQLVRHHFLVLMDRTNYLVLKPVFKYFKYIKMATNDWRSKRFSYEIIKPSSYELISAMVFYDTIIFLKFSRSY